MHKYKLIIFFFFFSATISIAQWDEESTANAQKLGEVFEYIDKLYVDDVDYDAISDAAIVAMLEELDPHSTYIPADNVARANERIDGSFVGIGIRFQILKDTLLVVNCIPGGPSEKVGLRAGDKIVKIEGENIAGTGLKNTDVRERLLGEKGTKVSIEVARKKANKPLDFTITRDKIPVHSVVSTYMIDDEVGYIKLTNFSRTTGQEMRSAIKELNNKGMKSLILDLQGNPGGLLYGAKYVADEFLKDDKLIVYSEGRSQPKSVLVADRKGNFEAGKLVVLIDENAASASEIVSGAIQDWDRGLIVGRRSFGKGLVQRPLELSSGGQVRLTIARYFTPSGRFIQKPYDDLDSYRNDYYERYKSGEMTSKDSIKLNDSLKYETMVNKRTVYGGGGIMPDVFVPLDTMEYSEFYRKLSRSGVINTFTTTYADKHRDQIKEEYKEFTDFKDNFETDESFMNKFFGYAVRENEELAFVEEDYEVSKDILQKRLKAMIAQNIWDFSAYYEIMNEKNEIFMRAYDIIKQNEYDLFNLSVN